MTAEKLQDAISLLPTDLVAATDRLRTAPHTRVIRWKQWVSLAACLVLLLSTGLVFRRNILPGMGAKTEAVMEAAPMEPQMAANSASPDQSAKEVVPEPPAEIGGGVITEVPAAEDGLCVDHSHRYAEETDTAGSTAASCGNMVTTVRFDGKEYSFGGADSVTVTNILSKLPYDPAEVCRCMAEFTVDTELLVGIEVNLTQGFARCELGQAALTQEQTAVLREIVNHLQ